MDYCRIEGPQPIETTHGIKNDPTETYFPMKNDIEWIKMALEWYNCGTGIPHFWTNLFGGVQQVSGHANNAGGLGFIISLIKICSAHS